MDRDRLGFDASGGDEPVQFPDVLDLDLVLLDDTLEGVPGKRRPQDVEGVDDQEASAGVEKRPGADHGEVGVEGAQAGLLFDSADQVVIGRVRLLDEGSSRCRGVVDQNIHPVFDVEPLGLHRFDAGDLDRRFLLGEEVLVALENVGMDLVDVIDDPGMVRVLAGQGLDPVLGRVPDDGFVELLDAGVGLAEAAHLADEGPDVLAQLLFLRLDVPFGGLVELLEFLGLDRLALVERNGEDAEARRVDLEPEELSLALEICGEGIPQPAEILLDLVALGFVVLALKDLRDLSP